MRVTRRGWIGATAAVAGASVFSDVPAQTGGSAAKPAIPDAPDSRFVVRAPGAGHDYTAALEALKAYARAELGAVGLPGMTLAVTDADGFTAVVGLGWADVDQRIPVSPSHYFQIGSISKSFIALTVLSLADQGKVDVDAPVAGYLPDAALPPEAITVAQLLSHTSGLPDGAPLFPRTPDGRLWSGFAPGSRFSYSNTGYVILGRLIERVTGLPHRKAVTDLVRRKLYLVDMAGTISQVRRPEFAVGYWPWNRTVASSLPGARLEVASWDEEDTPAGSIGATGDQMAIYLRALLRLGRGEGAPVLSDATARRFAAPVTAADADFGAGSHYACGVAIQPVDGAPCLHHTGGMMSFSSSFHADPAAGVACFASVNARIAGYRPRATTAYAIRLLRAVRAGAPLPAAPDPLAPYRVKTPRDFAGSYQSGDARLTLADGPDGLRLEAAGRVGRVAPVGADRLVTDHRVLCAYGLDAVRENGQVVALWWGDLLLGRVGAPRPRAATPEALHALEGDYLNRDPWVGGAKVVARGDTLWIDGVGPLVERGGWWSAQKDPGGVERARFDGMLGGQAQRLNASGEDLWRITV
jgi:CubicO group peptidase (beta-lactamase class C family)